MINSKYDASVRYKHNPFTENMTISIGTKRILLSKIGSDCNVAVNRLTGNALGTHVKTYKKADSSKFVKTFAENIAMTFELGPAGLKALNVLIFTIQNSGTDKDKVSLDKYCLEEFLSYSGQKLSSTTFTRGIKELTAAHIIARCLKQGDYFINPNFIFNGDRAEFTSAIEKEN